MISAKIICDSVSKHTGQRITTFELEYPRFIHSELMTHRLFSRNSSSSRAIPIQTMIDNIKTNTAMPIHWGKNQSGMQAKSEVVESVKQTVMQIWLQARDDAINHALRLAANGLHKQIVNRLLEPFQYIKVLVTATSFDNWFALRYHPDAQPEIQELAKVMYEALALSKPMELSYGEWHLPYIERERDDLGINYFILTNGLRDDLALEQAQKISCSCAAQVSYRKQDTSIEKAINIFDKLVNSEPVHASAFEHCATPAREVYYEYGKPDFTSLDDGITHVDININPCSGNFTNWIQYRQLIPSNLCTHFELGVN